MNRVTLIGRLGRDPELKFTPSGVPVCKLSLATSETWRDGQGKKQERTDWHNVVVWNAPAEACGNYLHKGSQVAIEGSMQTRSYEKDGVKKYVTEITARHVEFLGTGGGASGKSDAPDDRPGNPNAAPLDSNHDSDDDIGF